MKKILLLTVFAFIGFTSMEAQSDRTNRSDDNRTTRTSDRNDHTKGDASFEDTIGEMTSGRDAVNCDHLVDVLSYITENLGSDHVDANSLSAAVKNLPIDDCQPTRGCDCNDIRKQYADIVKQLRR